MEYFDLYSANRIPLGRSIRRGAPIPRGEYHIVVQVMTINRKGEILLTQRVPEKTSGGKWECSGSQIPSGKDSQDIVRFLFRLFRRDGLGEEIDACLQSSIQRSPEVCLERIIQEQATFGVAPAAQAEDDEVNAVRRYGLPIDLPLV